MRLQPFFHGPQARTRSSMTLGAGENTFLFAFFISLKKVTALDIIYVIVNDVRQLHQPLNFKSFIRLSSPHFFVALYKFHHQTKGATGVQTGCRYVKFFLSHVKMGGYLDI